MGYLKKNQRCVLLKLNSVINDIETIKDGILKNVVKEPIAKKDELKFDENNSETYFLSKWNDISEDIESISIPGGKTLRYIKATAYCEFTTRKFRDEKNKLLPKNERVNEQNTEVLFVADNKDIFAIVFTSDAYEFKRVERLINNGENSNTDPLTSKYQITPDIFTWLFYKYISTNEDIGDNITIRSITGFTGNIFSDENKIIGDSKTTPDLIVTKAFLANRNDIVSLKVEVDISNSTMSFYINENSTSGDDLRIMSLRGSEIPDDEQNTAEIYELMPIYIYFYVVPEIFNTYENEKTSFESDTKDNFLSELGIDVIKRIIAKNNLSKDDFNFLNNDNK